MKSRTSTRNVMEDTQPLQMGGGLNPSWWSIRPPPPVTTITTSYQQQHHHHPSYNLLLHPLNNNTFLPFNHHTNNSIVLTPYSPQPTSSSNSSSWHEHDNNHHQQPTDHHQQLPSETWSQLLLGGMDQDEVEKQSAAKLKMHNWLESQVIIQQQPQPQQHHHLLHDTNYDSNNSYSMDIKQEHNSIPSSFYNNNIFGQGNEELAATVASWSSIVMPPTSSPPKSCVTSFGNNNNSTLDFSSNYKGDGIRPHAPEHTSESNINATGGASKKARVQATRPQSNNILKVRKEKLGDRITTLHQLVSPFGKTDTASVLLETMGYIRFLQSQIEALSLPYLSSGGGSGSTNQQQQQPHLHDKSTEKDLKKDLKSRGLCLVPISCTLQVGNDNGADYWAPSPAAAFGGSGFH